MSERNALILVFSTALISGFSVFLNKYALATIEPSLFTFLKNGVVGILFFGVLLFLREWSALRSLSPQKWAQLVLIGLVGGAIPFVLFFQGLSLASAASGAFVHKTLFLFASILAVLLLREKMNHQMMGAAILLLVGNFFLLKIQSFPFGYGELLILIATLFWAVETVISKHALRELSGTVVGAARMTFGAGFILLYLFFTGGLSGVFSLSPNAWLWVAFTSGMLFLYVYTYYNGLKHIPVSVATSILLLGSPVTTLLSVVVSETPITEIQVAGMIVIMVGVWLALRANAFLIPFIAGAQSHIRNGW
jgi:drug/metabolite transporter (DMT)-like permease